MANRLRTLAAPRDRSLSSLTELMKQHKKDQVSERALVGLVGKRRKMLDYLKEVDIERYRAIVKQLGLRK